MRFDTGIETRVLFTPIVDSTADQRGNKRKRRDFCFVYIYPLNSNRELKSFAEPCLTPVETVNSNATELNPAGVLETLAKRIKKKLDSNYTRTMRAILNKS